MNEHNSTRTSVNGQVTSRPAPTTLVQRRHSRAHTSKYITRRSPLSSPSKPYSNHTTTTNYTPFVPQHVFIGPPTETHTRCCIYLKSEVRKKRKTKKAKLRHFAILALSTHIPSRFRRGGAHTAIPEHDENGLCAQRRLPLPRQLFASWCIVGIVQ